METKSKTLEVFDTHKHQGGAAVIVDGQICITYKSGKVDQMEEEVFWDHYVSSGQIVIKRGNKITVKDAANYLKEWADKAAVVKINQDDEYYYFAAKEYISGHRMEIRVRHTAEAGSHDIWERAAGSEEFFTWADAISVYR